MLGGTPFFFNVTLGLISPRGGIHFSSPLNWDWLWPIECGESEVVWVCKPWFSMVLQWSTERDGCLPAWGSGSNLQETMQLYKVYSVRLYDNHDTSINDHFSELKWSRIRQPQPPPTAKHMSFGCVDCPPSHPAKCMQLCGWTKTRPAEKLPDQLTEVWEMVSCFWKTLSFGGDFVM